LKKEGLVFGLLLGKIRELPALMSAKGGGGGGGERFRGVRGKGSFRQSIPARERVSGMDYYETGVRDGKRRNGGD